MTTTNATWVSRCCGTVRNERAARDWATCPKCRQATTYVPRDEYVPKPEPDVDQVNALIGTLAIA